MNSTDVRWKVASEVSQSRAHAEAVKLLREVRPTTRAGVFKQIADSIHKHPMLVEFFRARIYSPYNSKPGLYHPEDAFGDAFWAWKEWNDISDTSLTWADMSTDERFRVLLEKAVLKASKGGPADLAGEDHRDYFHAGLSAKSLVDVLRRLEQSIPTEENRLKALALVEEITQMLK